MDRNTTIGFVLIGLVLIVWMWMQAPPPPGARPPLPDSLRAVQVPPRDTVRPAPRPVVPDTAERTPAEIYGTYFAPRAAGEEKVIVVATDLYTAEITTKGGLLRKWELTAFKTWDGRPVELVDFDRGGDLSLLFTSGDGKLINTRSLYFEARERPWTTYRLTGSQSIVIDMTLPLGEGRSIVKRMTFTNGKYSFDTEFDFAGMGEAISNFEYQIVWENGLRYAERNSVDESSFAQAYAFSGGELTDIDATKIGETVKRDINGNTDWVATRSKYFALAMMPEHNAAQGAYLEGTRTGAPDNGVREIYTLALKMPLATGAERARVTVFLGPLDYDIIKGYDRGLDQIMSLGAAWIIRPIAEYVMIPLFKFLHMFIPNYGWVIIIFSVIIKLALQPLTRSSMKSMKRMQALTPLMNEIREKYKEDPNKQNQQIMNLYKEYGVNPAAGCLPMLLQMPILFALYAVFRSTIGLRQSAFMLWITDLSIPDTVVHLPFKIPLFGMTDLSGLALAMGVTMFLQQKMTVTDPRQKAMVWMMPLMMTLIFNSLASGLNLYYFVFNLLAIGQQLWFNKRTGDEPLRKVEPKKGGGGLMARLAKNMPDVKRR
ncbi:MAG TPA: membrane protein insertase YidC [Bacteroidota bacterium]|nr:membrane protein insertase YidC [Bacteroidota bacterium]